MNGVVIAIISAFSTLGAAGIAAFVSLRRSQQQIHVLVNNRLTEALSEIRRLGGNEEKF